MQQNFPMGVAWARGSVHLSVMVNIDSRIRPYKLLCWSQILIEKIPALFYF